MRAHTNILASQIRIVLCRNCLVGFDSAFEARQQRVVGVPLLTEIRRGLVLNGVWLVAIYVYIHCPSLSNLYCPVA